MEPLFTESELRDLNAAFEGASPEDILRWALTESPLPRIAIASAFQTEGTCVMDMAVRIRPDVPVLFLETGFHFAETLAFKQQLTERLGLSVVDLVGDHGVEGQAREFGERLYERDPNLCCELNKVIPMVRALRGLDAWITAFRRDSSPTRADAPFVDQYELEPGRPMVKVNPIANWTRKQVFGYLKEHDLPRNPLYDVGFASIGCAPCTRLVFPGEDERAGRWSGVPKWECGIHVAEAGRQQAVAAEPAIRP